MSHVPVNTEELRQSVVAALQKAIDPCSVAAGRPMNLVEMGLVDEVVVDATGVASVRLSLTSPSCMMLGQILDQIDEHVMPLLGGIRPQVTLDDGMTWTPERITGEARTDRDRRRQALLSLTPVRS